MSGVFTAKNAPVMGVVVLIVLLVQIESFADQNWEGISQLPTDRWGLAAAVVDDKIYIIGGTLNNNVRGPDGTSIVEAYDSHTNTWRQVADMPTPRTYPYTAVVKGSIYVFGGWYNEKGGKIKYPVVVEVYDPETDTWTQKKDMPVSRVHPAIGVVDEKIYIIGGSTGWGPEHVRQMDRVDIYNPATDTWEQGPKMPTRRDPYLGGVVNNHIYVISGYGFPAGQVVPVIEEYDPSSRQWRNMQDMLHVKSSFRTVVVEDDIYVIEGINGLNQYLSTVDVYHPHTETWSDIPAMPRPIYPQGAATVDGKIYVFGGVGAGRQFFSDVLVFDTEDTDFMPSRQGTNCPQIGENSKQNGKENHKKTGNLYS